MFETKLWAVIQFEFPDGPTEDNIGIVYGAFENISHAMKKYIEQKDGTIKKFVIHQNEKEQ